MDWLFPNSLTFRHSCPLFKTHLQLKRALLCSHVNSVEIWTISGHEDAGWVFNGSR